MPSLLKFGLRGYVYRNTFIAVIKRISPQNVLREKYVLGTIPRKEKNNLTLDRFRGRV